MYVRFRNELWFLYIFFLQNFKNNLIVYRILCSLGLSKKHILYKKKKKRQGIISCVYSAIFKRITEFFLFHILTKSDKNSSFNINNIPVVNEWLTKSLQISIICYRKLAAICFGSNKRNPTLLQTKISKHEWRNVAATLCGTHALYCVKL